MFRAAAVLPPMVLPEAPAVDLDAVGAVGDRGGARGIGADEVARDHVAGRARAGDLDAVTGVARDDVAGPGRRSPPIVLLNASLISTPSPPLAMAVVPSGRYR